MITVCYLVQALCFVVTICFLFGNWGANCVNNAISLPNDLLARPSLALSHNREYCPVTERCVDGCLVDWKW